jgi:hypothetical protein
MSLPPATREFLVYLKKRKIRFEWVEGKENVWVPDDKGSFEHAIVKRRDARNATVELQNEKVNFPNSNT